MQSKSFFLKKRKKGKKHGIEMNERVLSTFLLIYKLNKLFLQ